jgi:hypothetical protein
MLLAAGAWLVKDDRVFTKNSQHKPASQMLLTKIYSSYHLQIHSYLLSTSTSLVNISIYNTVASTTMPIIPHSHLTITLESQRAKYFLPVDQCPHSQSHHCLEWIN